jgi:Ser-tRNA(Ala) deacylase AlaX
MEGATLCRCCQGSGKIASLGECPLCNGVGYFLDDVPEDVPKVVEVAQAKDSLSKTSKVYWQDTWKYKHTAHFVREGVDKEICFVVLTETIFHARGGGQPADEGVIFNEGTCFRVSGVLEIGEEVYHYGTYENDEHFKADSEVAMEINPEVRQAYARRHSAAHLIDQSCILLGYNLKSEKGFITQNTSYVEYGGDIPTKERAAASVAIQEKINELVQANTTVTVSMQGGSRIVEMAGYPSPCSGTHVHLTGEVGNVVLEKLKVKNGKLRITFDLK